MSSTDDDRGKMPFLAHLAELRSCMVRAAVAIFVSSVAAFIWAGALFEFLTLPLIEHFHGAELIGTGPADAFLVKLKVAILAGIIVSSPYWFYQLWQFVSPGMHDKEKRLAIPFVLGSTLCFLVGISFCFFVLFPFAFNFFQGEFVSIGIKPQIRIGEYFSFVVKLLLVFGFVFELPVLSYFLARLRLLHHRWLMRNGRYAVVVIFVVAAILTPPDVVTQCLLALPLLVLYLICIAITYWFNPDAKKPVVEKAPPPIVPEPLGSVPKDTVPPTKETSP